MIKTILVALAGAIGLWLMSVALIDLWNYWRLDHSAPARVTSWKVVELSPSEYVLKASYRFVIKGKEWKGKAVLNPVYLNQPSAEKAVLIRQKEEWQAWYNSKKPKISSLQKEFPAKKCLHALVALGVFGYFYGLKRYLDANSNNL